MAGGCVARLTVSGFAASAQRPVVVNATEGEAGGDVATLTLTDPDPHVFEVPLPAGRDVADVRIDIPGATSPNALGMSADTRTLGVALSRIDVGHR